MRLGTAIRRIGWFALLASLWPGVGQAQTTVLEGRATDYLGGTINGAVVTLNSPGTTAPRTTRTGADGTFSFDGVPVGSVSLQVEAPGFERSTRAVPLTASMAPLAVVLQISGVAENDVLHTSAWRESKAIRAAVDLHPAVRIFPRPGTEYTY